MAHGNELLTARLLSGRYANASHTAAVIKTAEFGNIACSDADFALLWERRREIELTPFDTTQIADRQYLNQETEAEGHAASKPSDEPVLSGGIEPPALPPPPEAFDQDPEPIEAPTIGDWRLAIQAMADLSDEELDFESPDDRIDEATQVEATFPEELPVEEVQAEPIVEAVIEEPVMIQQEPTPTPPPVPKTVVISETKTIRDDTWAKAEVRYQLAIQAKNGSSYAKGLMKEAAARRNMTVMELAEAILAERREQEHLVMSEF